MSRQIDLTQPLDDDAKTYLANFGSPEKIEQVEAALDNEGVTLPTDPEKAREVSLANQANTGMSSPSADELRGAKAPAPVTVRDYTREDYESWNVPDLKAEITERNEGRDADSNPPEIVPADQKKAALVDALVADDEATKALVAEDGDDSSE